MAYIITASNGTTLEKSGSKLSVNPAEPMKGSKEEMLMVVDSLSTFETGLDFSLKPVSKRVEMACEYCGAPHHPEETRCM